MTSTLSQIQEIVVRAVPEIMEPGFGCKLIPKNVSAFKWVDPGESAIIVRVIGGGEVARIVWSDTRISTEELSDFEIIGRPIHLTDILLAIGTVYPFKPMQTAEFYLVCDLWGNFCDENGSDEATWNLRKDSLEDQSEETLAFLLKVLKGV